MIDTVPIWVMRRDGPKGVGYYPTSKGSYHLLAEGRHNAEPGVIPVAHLARRRRQLSEDFGARLLQRLWASTSLHSDWE